MDTPRQNSLVTTASPNQLVKPTDGMVYVFLGEIPNMGGHCIVMNISDGTIDIGYHTGDFRELTDDEV